MDSEHHAANESKTILPGGIGSRARWFLAELVVIIAGVLIALAIDEWRDSRQDADLELQYLNQLIADLQVSEAQIADSIADNAGPEAAGRQFLSAFESGKLEDIDVIGQWLSEMRRFSTAIPVLGSMEALISTGDLRLIGSPIARSGITRYLSSMHNYMDRTESYENLSRDLYIRILIVAQNHGLTPNHLNGMSNSTTTTDPAGVFSNPEAYSLAERFVANRERMAGSREGMLEETIELRELLTGQLP